MDYEVEKKVCILTHKTVALKRVRTLTKGKDNDNAVTNPIEAHMVYVINCKMNLCLLLQCIQFASCGAVIHKSTPLSYDTYTEWYSGRIYAKL